MLRSKQEINLDTFDPYRFDTPDSYALKTGDYSTGGLTDPCDAALNQGSEEYRESGATQLTKIEKVFAVVGGIAFLGIAILSW